MTITIVPTADETTWLHERTKSMGGSDIAAADSGRYGGAAKAVASKLGLDTGDTIDPADADRGHRWEQPIADGVLAHFGLYVHGEQALVRNPATPWVHATLDGLLHPRPHVQLDDLDLNLETKTRRPHAPWPWDYYRPQTQIGMHCTGARRCLLAIATIDVDYDTDTGQVVETLLDVRYEWVERDQAEIDRLVNLAFDLWEHVTRGELPDPDGPEALPWVKAANAELCPNCSGTGLVEGEACVLCGGRPDIDDLVDLIERREQLRSAVKAAEAEADTIEAQIRHRMGGATEAVAEGRWRVRCGAPIRKFLASSEDEALARHPEYGVLTLDRARFKAEQPDEYEALKVATSDRRLTTKNLQPEESQ